MAAGATASDQTQLIQSMSRDLASLGQEVALLKASVAPDSTVNAPVATSLPATFSVPDAASTVPVLLRETLMVVVPLPPVLLNVPALLNVLALPLSVASAVA